ncbi:MAG: AAA family ATPase, partial [Chloroflexota bacterium]
MSTHFQPENDVGQFDLLWQNFQQHVHAENKLCPACHKSLLAADALYLGDFMEGFSLKDSYEFDDWQFFERDRLRRQYAQILDQLAVWETAAGNNENAIRYAQKWLALDRLHEPAHQQLMKLYSLTGQRTAALRQYRVCTRIMEEELGVQPLEETTALYHQILESGGKPKFQPAATAKVTLSASDPTLLGAQILVGRNEELSKLQKILNAIKQDGQIVGVIGEAGIGKTRLVEDFYAQPENSEHVAIIGRGYRGEDDRPYGTIVDGLRETISRPELQEKIAQIPKHWLREASRLLPELVEISSISETHTFLEGPGAQGRLFEALRQIIAACVTDRVGILWMDDLTWADQASTDFLAYLARNLNGLPVMLIFCWRDDGEAQAQRLENIFQDAARHKLCTLLPLVLLSAAEVRTLSQISYYFPVIFLDHLIKTSEGLPFFVVEYLALAGSTDMS